MSDDSEEDFWDGVQFGVDRELYHGNEDECYVVVWIWDGGYDLGLASFATEEEVNRFLEVNEQKAYVIKIKPSEEWHEHYSVTREDRT
jgi:hypothetical protein